ncbi:MAG: ATP-binding cassette domain-containing protein [Sulfolobales archaeon]
MPQTAVKPIKTSVLIAKDLWFRYPSSPDWVLRGVNLVADLGEVVLIIGASGSGKTTLLRSITGIGELIYGGEARGTIMICGRSLSELSIDELRGLIQVVNQNAYTHFIEHSVRADLYYSSIAIHGFAKGERLFKKVVSIFKLDDLLKRKFFELSGGQLRRAAIAKAMLWDPLVVVMDEPLMWLDDEGLEEVREVIVTLKSLGKAVIVFEHRFLSLLDLTSRIYLLKNGTLAPLDHGQLKYPRRAPSAFLSNVGLGSDREDAERIERKETSFRAMNVWFKYERDNNWVLKGVSLDVDGLSGAIVIYGRNGSGKSTLLKVLAGYLAPMRGRVQRSPGVRAVYLPQNIYLFFTEDSLIKELQVACSQHRSGEDCVERGIRNMRNLGVNLDVGTSPFNLSWGQAMRTAVSIALSVGGKQVLLLDEPFTGLTYADRLALAKLLARIEVPKVITLSNKETVSIIPRARVFELRDGYLVTAKQEVISDVFEAAEKCKELGISGAP